MTPGSWLKGYKALAAALVWLAALRSYALIMYHTDDTIIAVASAAGGAARGIVRISGPLAFEVVAQFCRDATNQHILLPRAGSHQAGPKPASTTLVTTLQLPELTASLPCDLFVWPEGQSYTGQQVVEIHTLGSPPLLDAVLETLCGAGARLAEPGEFTLRAFLSGRIDLTQAEAVLGVIDARDPRQFDVALAQLAGGLAAPLHSLRTSLLDLLAHLEASLDFADEEIEFISADEVQHQLCAAAETVAGLRDQMKSRNVSHTHTRAVLVGPPNAGKSSLFNALAQRSGALVSSEPGTTRDYLVAELNLDGVACHLVDTAGMEEIRLTHFDETYVPDHTAQTLGDEQRRMAEIWILCLDATRPELGTSLLTGEESDNVHILRVLTKADAISAPIPERCELATSSTTGQGIESLRTQLRETIVAQDDNGRAVAATASRCRESLAGAGESLRRAGKLAADGIGEELVAAEIRVALDELGKVVGAVYTDDVLDRIFSRFCIGK